MRRVCLAAAAMLVLLSGALSATAQTMASADAPEQWIIECIDANLDGVVGFYAHIVAGPGCAARRPDMTTRSNSIEAPRRCLPKRSRRSSVRAMPR